jgi:hypothetical protein
LREYADTAQLGFGTCPLHARGGRGQVGRGSMTHKSLLRGRGIKALIGLSCFAVATSALVTLELAAPVRAASCGTVAASDGFRAAAITTQRLSCSRGRAVLRRWLADHGRPVDGPRGWDCSFKSSGRWRCTRSGAVLAFTYIADEP